MASLDDFHLREVETNEDLCATVAENRHLSPYCLDYLNRHMIFAETPPEIELSARPFYYQAQYEAATRLIAIPYDRVHEIAARAHGRAANPVFIFSVGRCGSTLMSKMFGRLDATYSLSEPDVFTAINYLHGEGRLIENEAIQLLASTVRVRALIMSPPSRKISRVDGSMFATDLVTRILIQAASLAAARG